MLLVLCQTRHPVHSPHWGSETGSWRQNASVALGDTQSQEKYIAEMEKNKKKIFDTYKKNYPYIMLYYL